MIGKGRGKRGRESKAGMGKGRGNVGEDKILKKGGGVRGNRG